MRIGGLTLAEITSSEVVRPAHPLTSTELHGPGPVLLSSDLFCSVELADLTLRYAR